MMRSPGGHELPDGGVGDIGDGDMQLLEDLCRDTGFTQGPGLGADQAEPFPLLGGRGKDAHQGARIAVHHDRAAVLDQVGPVLPEVVDGAEGILNDPLAERRDLAGDGGNLRAGGEGVELFIDEGLGVIDGGHRGLEAEQLARNIVEPFPERGHVREFLLGAGEAVGPRGGAPERLPPLTFILRTSSMTCCADWNWMSCNMVIAPLLIWYLIESGR